eukprot:scaffold16162_cov21-Prasinocladus_malaysianus.AAC.1
MAVTKMKENHISLSPSGLGACKVLRVTVHTCTSSSLIQFGSMIREIITYLHGQLRYLTQPVH